MNPILLVAKREFLVKVYTKSFVIVNALLLVVVVAGLIVWAAVRSDDDGAATKIGVTGSATSLSETIVATGRAAGTTIEIVDVAGPDEARAQVENGDLEAAFVGDADVVVEEDLSPELRAVLQSAVQQNALDGALRNNGVDPAELAAQVGDTNLAVTALHPQASDHDQRIALALVGAVLLFIGVANFAPAVGMGVTEEKSSRVVELLLSTIKPLHLLWGKIIGLGAVGLAQVVVIASAGLITAQATGLLEIPTAAAGMLIATLVWFVLGFVFFATLYAAGGSMVSRVEEINSTTLPVMLLLMASAYLGFFGVGSLDSNFYSIISWIPPFSSILMPMQIAAGNASTFEVVGTIALMVAACAASAWVSARIYQRSVLLTGAKVSWAHALGR